MPFRVLGHDLIDPAGVCYLPGPEFARASLPERDEMSNRLKVRLGRAGDSSPSDGGDLTALREPESFEAPYSYLPYLPPSPIVVMTVEELSMAGSATIPPPPRLKRAGNVKSHIGERFVLGGSKEAYRIWGFRSAKSPIEFPVTEEGWATAWTKFRALERQMDQPEGHAEQVPRIQPD